MLHFRDVAMLQMGLLLVQLLAVFLHWLSNPEKLETLIQLFPTLFNFGLGAMGNLLILQSSLGFGCTG